MTSAGPTCFAVATVPLKSKALYPWTTVAGGCGRSSDWQSVKGKASFSRPPFPFRISGYGAFRAHVHLIGHELEIFLFLSGPEQEQRRVREIPLPQNPLPGVRIRSPGGKARRPDQTQSPVGPNGAARPADLRERHRQGSSACTPSRRCCTRRSADRRRIYRPRPDAKQRPVVDYLSSGRITPPPRMYRF